MNERASLVAVRKLMGIGAMDDRGSTLTGRIENLREVDKIKANHGGHGLMGGG